MKRWHFTIFFALLTMIACTQKGDDGGLVGTPVYAYQDLPFSYSVGSLTAGGTYSTSSLGSWATLNSSTGVISGTPSTAEDGFLFSATQTVGSATNKFGPYQVTIVGNPLKEFQWHLHNTGQTAFSATAGTAGQDMHLSSTINSGITGAGVKIAISDSGVLLSHEALQANALLSLSRNYLNNYATTHSWLGDPTPDLTVADDAHGTAVASLAAESGWNGVGGRGMAPDAKVAGFLFIQAQSQLGTEGLSTAALNDQFEGPFDVFNYSWGDDQCQLTEYPASTFAAMLNGVTNQRSGLGSIYLMAAGNSYIDDITACYPGGASGNYYGNANFSAVNTSPYTIIVGAVNADGISSSYSTPGSNIWISATGGEYGLSTNIPGSPEASEPAMIAADFPGCSAGLKSFYTGYSDFDTGGSPNQNCLYTSTMNGTSAATPVASGAVALMLQANPNLSWRDVKYILASTADKIDASVNPIHHPDTSYDLSGHNYDQGWITNFAGFHFMNYYGFGRINVDAAVAMAKAYTFPLGTYQTTNWADDSGVLNLSIPDASATGVTSTLNVASTLTIESLQLRATISACTGDIGIELTSPKGTKSVLMNINSLLRDTSIADHTFLSNAFYGEPANGTWTIKVIDGHTGCTAKLTNWKLNISGH